MQLDDIVVGYARVSTRNQLENGEGLQIQKKAIEDYCKDKGLKLAKIFEDKATSGTIRQRPALLQLLKSCETGHIKKVIIYRQDRLSRQLGVSLWLEERFREYGVEVISLLEPQLSTNDPTTKALRRMIGIFSELEKEILCSRLEAGRLHKARRGIKMCGPTGFGYFKNGERLEINPEQGRWVVKIYRWLVRGHGYTAIIRKLEKAGVRTKRGKKFSVEGLKYILSNSLYSGESTFGDIRCKGNHQRIVSRRLFLKAQKILKKKLDRN